MTADPEEVSGLPEEEHEVSMETGVPGAGEETIAEDPTDVSVQPSEGGASAQGGGQSPTAQKSAGGEPA
jgi:hypothetical protein